MTRKKAASAPAAPAARPAQAKATPLTERPCPKGPTRTHLWLDQVEGDGRVRHAFAACRYCGGRLDLGKVHV